VGPIVDPDGFRKEKNLVDLRRYESRTVQPEASSVYRLGIRQ